MFDGRKAVLFDDRWASAREDLARLWLMDEGEIDADWARLSERFEGAGHVVGTQASWWQGKALAAGRNIHASLFGRAAAGAENPGKGRYSDEIAVVTGASKGSIAASVVGELLDGGATVIATTSKLDDDRLAFYRTLYRDNARFGAALWVVPANMASYTDIDALVHGSVTSRPKPWAAGDSPQGRADADAAVPVRGTACGWRPSEAGSRSEMEMKVLLWAVQRLIGGLSHIGSERDIGSRLHVVLPGSPNRGMFGGDGAYGESKSALDARGPRWKADVMGAAGHPGPRADRLDPRHRPDGCNDAIVNAVEEAGVTTYSTEEMATMLLNLCDIESKVAAAQEPLQADLTGGLGEIDIDMAELAAKAREEWRPSPDADDERGARHDAALPSPPRGYRLRRRPRGTTSTSTPPTWWSSSAAPSSGPTARRGPASRWRSTASCRPRACSSWPGPPD